MALSIETKSSVEHCLPEAPVSTLNSVRGKKLNAVSRIARIAGGQPSASDIAWLQQMFDLHLRDNGSIPLERRLGLPTTFDKWRLFNRDMYLCQAALCIEADGAWSGAQKLEAEWTRFIDRGGWRFWRTDLHPPEEATQLSKALFYATQENRSESLSAQQIYRIVQHIFQEKCR